MQQFIQSKNKENWEKKPERLGKKPNQQKKDQI